MTETWLLHWKLIDITWICEFSKFSTVARCMFSQNLYQVWFIYALTHLWNIKKALPHLWMQEIKNIFLYNQRVNIIHPVYIQLLKNITIVNGNQKLIITKIHIFSLLSVICTSSHPHCLLYKICFNIILLSICCCVTWSLCKLLNPVYFWTWWYHQQTQKMRYVVITGKVWTLEFFMT
jgi:hypothetical protein